MRERQTTPPGKLPLLFSNGSVGSFTPPLLWPMTEGWRRQGQRLIVTAQWRDRLNWDKVSNHSQQINMISPVFWRLWLLVRPLFEPMTSHLADWCCPNWANPGGGKALLNFWLREQKESSGLTIQMIPFQKDFDMTLLLLMSQLIFVRWSFSKYAVMAETSYQVFEVVTFCVREWAYPPSLK